MREGKLAGTTPYQLIFAICATTQQYRNFDTQVLAVLGPDPGGEAGLRTSPFGCLMSQHLQESQNFAALVYYRIMQLNYCPGTNLSVINDQPPTKNPTGPKVPAHR